MHLTHTTLTRVTLQICAALANLGTHEKNPKKAARAGVLPAIVTAMLENPKSATLQSHCSRAIASLTWHDEDIKREAREVQAAEACNAALAIHPKDEARRGWWTPKHSHTHERRCSRAARKGP